MKQFLDSKIYMQEINELYGTKIFSLQKYLQYYDIL